MRILLSLLVLPLGGAALAHESTVPHLHPHAVSILPDYAAMLLAGMVVVGAVVAYRVWRKE